MKLRDFIKDKIIYIICFFGIAIVSASMLTAFIPAGGREILVFAGMIYLIGAMIPLTLEYQKKKAFYNVLITFFDRLDRKNLISEIILSPDFFEGALLYDTLKASNKACLEEINRYKNLQAEYREYIEIWVHEIKTPISSSKLIAQNHRSEAVDSIAEELDAIENYVEQALFYARSNAVENDYMIKEVYLKKPVYTVLKRDSKPLICANISVAAENLDVTVYSDSKWIEFILHQLIINAVKYAAQSNARIEITAKETDNRSILTVFDNGLGIPQSELPKIFEKGFTGTNGRMRGKSTGMGLYICKKLCDKLGISISADSSPGQGTTFSLIFPKNSMTDII